MRTRRRHHGRGGEARQKEIDSRLTCALNAAQIRDSEPDRDRQQADAHGKDDQFGVAMRTVETVGVRERPSGEARCRQAGADVQERGHRQADHVAVQRRGDRHSEGGGDGHGTEVEKGIGQIHSVRHEGAQNADLEEGKGRVGVHAGRH